MGFEGVLFMEGGMPVGLRLRSSRGGGIRSSVGGGRFEVVVDERVRGVCAA